MANIWSLEKAKAELCRATNILNTGLTESYEADDSPMIEVEEMEEASWINEFYDDFVKARGEPTTYEKTPNGMKIYLWENQQSRKGCRRGNLFLMGFETDMGLKFLAHFDGEVGGETLC